MLCDFSKPFVEPIFLTIHLFFFDASNCVMQQIFFWDAKYLHEKKRKIA
jgi:hypothetical protein